MELFKLFGTIAVNNDKANDAIDETTNKGEQAENKLSSAFKKIGAAVATYFAVDKIISFGREVVNIAAEVSAEVSAFEQIMGDYSEEASKKVEKIADATGMVSTRLTPYMTSMTAKFKGLGYDIDSATNLASDGLNLATDAAAFWDKSLDDSMSHLNSFINGSYEGGEAIGLFANDTQMAAYAVKTGVVDSTKAWSSLNEATKQATRLEYAKAMYEQSGATGQAAKEAGQYANVQANLTEKWRQFKAQIGEPILQNIVLPAMEKLSGLVDKASDAFQFLQKHSAAVKAVLIPLATIIGIVTTALAMQATVQGIKAAMNAAEVTSLGALIAAKWADAAATMAALAPYLLIAAAIAALIAIIVLLVKNWDKVKETAQKVWEKIKEIWGKVAEWFKTNVIDPVVNFFKGLWEDIKNVWDTIVNIVQFAILFIASIIQAAFDLITLPFRFIWENCKEYVFAAWEWIKEKTKLAWLLIKAFIIDPIKNAYEKVKEWITKAKNKAVEIWGSIRDKAKELWNKIKENVINPIKDAYTKVKDFFDKIKNAIKEKIEWARDKAKSAADKIRSNIVDPISKAYTKVKETFDNIKNAIKEKIEWARDKVKGAIDKIKGFFDFKWELPKLKLPHFSIKGKFSLNPPSVPKLSIDWYKRAYDAAAMFTSPTVIPTLGGYKGFGDGNGAEFVTGQQNLLNTVKTAVKQETAGTVDRLEKLISMLAEYMPELIDKSNKQIVLNNGVLVGELAPTIDSRLGEINRLRERGR